MLQLDQVEAGYGDAKVLFGIDLRIGVGEGVALLGRNGAGKSTTLKAVLGLVTVTAGTIRLEGAEITGWPVHRVAAAGVGWVPEDRRVFAGLTVAENIAAASGGPPGPWTPDRLKRLFPKLEELWHRRAGLLSGGEQQMLTVARTLATNPRVLLLDEPSEGLAPLVVAAMAEAVAAIKAEGMALLVSEQNLSFVRPVTDRAAVIDQGRLVWQGALAELERNAAVMDQHLAV